MARFRIEVDAPKPRVVEMGTIHELDAEAAEMVASLRKKSE